MAGIRKRRRTFLIDVEVLDQLRSIKTRTGLSESEQVRQGIRWWLESRAWPQAQSRTGRIQASGKTTTLPPDTPRTKGSRS